MHPAIFNNIANEYNFSIVLNLFDNNNDPYAVSTHRWKKVRTKCTLFGEGLIVEGI